MPLAEKYEIIEEISSGELTRVYKARHRILDRTVLLKILHKRLVTESDIAERFKREAKIAASIDHPHVAGVYDCGEFDGQPYIAFEWIEGENLYQYIRRISSAKDTLGQPGRIPLSDIMTITASLLNGLSAIHAAGVVHRDLKPENAMIDRSGVVKLTDFSLSFSGKMPRLTQHGDLVGTPGYMAPEVIAGEKPTVKSDLFAAGLIIWELLTGKNPFEAEDLFQTLQKVQEAKFPDLDNLRTGIPEDLKNVIFKLVARRSEDRFQSAAEAGQRLSALRDYPQIEAKRSQSGLRIPAAPVVQNKVEYASKLPIVLFIFLISASIIVGGWFWIHQGTGTDPPENSPPVMKDSLLSDTDTYDSLLAVNSEPEIFQGENALPVKSSSNRSAEKVIETGTNSPPDNPPEGDPAEVPDRSSPKESVQHDSPQDKESPASEGSLPLSGGDLIDDRQQVESVLGYLKFSVNPWARIYVDGGLKGDSPLGFAVEASQGEHAVVLDNPYFPRMDFEYTVTGGETLQVEINLFDHIGAVSFDIQPWGYIAVDSVQMGVSPLPLPLYLQPGLHYIKVEHPNFPNYERTLMVLAGDDISLLIDLTKPFESPANKIE
ncbi:MAG: serine/threonine protein kinase [FCB group bacterium]|nr:serine/threonine protein kinase [FCB group bacterium]